MAHPETPDTVSTVTRTQAAQRLGLTKSGVRRLVERGKLKPTQAKRKNGPVLFNVEEVERLAAERRATQADEAEVEDLAGGEEAEPESVPATEEPETSNELRGEAAQESSVGDAESPPGPTEGDIAARVFADLNARRPLTEIVAERKVPPAVVMQLWREWREMNAADANAPMASSAVDEVRRELKAEVQRIEASLGELTERVGRIVDARFQFHERVEAIEKYVEKVTADTPRPFRRSA